MGLQQKLTAVLAECEGGTEYKSFADNRVPASRVSVILVALDGRDPHTVEPSAAATAASAAVPPRWRRAAGGRSSGVAATTGAAPAPPDVRPLHEHFPLGLWASSWHGVANAHNIVERLTSWKAVVAVLSVYACCALCAITRNPTPEDTAGWQLQDADPSYPPPYAMLNALHPGQMTGDNGKGWLLCPNCTEGVRTRANCWLQHVPFLPPEYVHVLCSLNAPLQMQLALVNAGAGFLANANGFFTMRLSRLQAMGGAVLSWDPAPAVRGALMAAGLQEILGWSIANNPIYTAFLSVAEQPNKDTSSPFLTCDIVAGFVSQARARGPLICGTERTLATELIGVIMPAAPPPSAFRAPPTSYGGGVLRWRHGGGSAAVTMLPDGSPAPTTAHVPGSDHPITAELALFPYLFPYAPAAYMGGPHTLAQYLNFRAYSFFSVFIRQTTMLYTKSNKAVLEKAVRVYLKSHPGASDAAILKHVIRYSLPSNIPNTPGWHRKNLLDLLALVDRWGMPTCFLTVTADELSMTRWGEVAAMEEHLEKFCTSYTWKDAPAENAYLFHKHVRLFMDKVLRAGRGGNACAAAPLGRIQHYVSRYEVQNWQSLHAHILLWVHPDDVERITSEIIACVPADYRGDASVKTCPTYEEMWVEPEDESQKALFQHVMRKQMHHCSPAKQPGCCKSGICQYGFPWKPYNLATPTVDPICRRFRITSTDWSFYVLKYALKAEPCGALNLDNLSCVALGLPKDPPAAKGEPSYVVKLINAFLCSTVVSPTLAWLMCANIHTVHMSSGVLFIDSEPPDSQTRAVLPGARLQTPPVDVYMLRPVQLEDVMFRDFYLRYALVAVKPRARTTRRRAQQAVQGRQVRKACRQGPPKSTFIGPTMDGHLSVFRLTEPGIVHFSDPHPAADSEGYFYNLLLVSVPFRHEKELCSEVNLSKTFEECHLQQLVNNTSDLEVHLESYANHHLFNLQRRQALLAALLGKYKVPEGMEDDLDPDAPTFGVNYSCLPEQQTVVDAVKQRSSGLLVLKGGPGSGKTFTTKKLTRELHQAGKTVLLSASTGAAAVRL
ncbi:hypothetical protein HYH03_016088 [Edaphochlamys debaryana]|uniref:Helitron helicase-like domain-containing protein n=1 Tax=Edaphochlamys debaryana TaxID=47281 RepID=A0A836BRU7_9CHLO|nr:hypothetical protein HYH03_016088 [Edaphochlamys debaryana]|eukprot:KAG2485199.1 hypothetical protein HYH03_016088 [Edaphochlamys debaryana]